MEVADEVMAKVLQTEGQQTRSLFRPKHMKQNIRSIEF
jgi:hypothetical protein